MNGPAWAESVNQTLETSWKPGHLSRWSVLHSSGVSEAARRMGVSAAAVSKNVARLESNLGARLFSTTCS
jgi:hypothetical protein